MTPFTLMTSNRIYKSITWETVDQSTFFNKATDTLTRLSKYSSCWQTNPRTDHWQKKFAYAYIGNPSDLVAMFTSWTVSFENKELNLPDVGVVVHECCGILTGWPWPCGIAVVVVFVADVGAEHGVEAWRSCQQVCQFNVSNSTSMM